MHDEVWVKSAPSHIEEPLEFDVVGVGRRPRKRRGLLWPWVEGGMYGKLEECASSKKLRELVSCHHCGIKEGSLFLGDWLQEDPPAGVSGAPTDNNIMIWNAVIFGPHDTPFEDGTFKLTLEFTEEYPNKPPTVRFVSKMFHPNVYADGSICLDILQNRWSPTYDVSAILTSIQSLLDEPNPNSPANSLAAQLYQENRREYEKRVAAIVEQSWLNFNDDDDKDAKKDAS
ncbi:hypothetical protein HPB47_021507 [Ixodes persulcatus]|uniref:Uncharacterized protein n=1 Tax=Ixodes persulcatus TaxID=34615 RepID=A0AC60QCD0_IXOPE|nr:hypothetical protein HPB47_021507 [Ixodes persulcatus]